MYLQTASFYGLTTQVFRPAALPAAAFRHYNHRDSLCVVYNATMTSSLDALSMYGDFVMPNGDVLEVDYPLTPVFSRSTVAYDVVLPFPVSTIYVRGVRTESHSNVFFDGVAQPRFGYSQGLAVSNGTNLVTAMVLASNDQNFTLYNVTVRVRHGQLQLLVLAL